MSEKIQEESQAHFKEYGVKKSIPHFETPEFKEYRRKWHKCPEKLIVPDYPLNLDIHVTNNCNLKCPFCPRTWKAEGGYYPEYGYLDFGLFKKIMDEASQYGLDALQFTADGETLLHSRLEEMISYANQKGVLDIIVHTNAVALTEKKARSLLEAGMHRLAVSFDSPYKETYEKLRLGANFEKTLENIKRFMKLRDEMKLSLPTVRVQMVDQKANQDERQAFDDLFIDIVDTVGHAYYINYFGGPESYMPDGDYSSEKFAIGRKKFNESFRCSYLWQRLIIHWNGEVLPCFYGDTLLDKGNKDQISLGNLADPDTTVHSIWHGEKMTRLRELHKAGRYEECEVCKGCGRQNETHEE